MTRALRRKRRQAREERAGIESLIAEIARSGIGRPGMTPAEVLELLSAAAERIGTRMTRAGLCRREPWGLSFDARSLRATIDAGLLMLHTGEGRLDAAPGTGETLTDEESARILLEIVQGALTLGGAAILYLASSPIPYTVARHFSATENKP